MFLKLFAKKNWGLNFGRKGQLVLVILFGALILLTIASIIFAITQKYGDSEEIVKSVFAEEVRLSINALIASPSDAIIKLPKEGSYNVSNFRIALRDGYVEVENPDDPSLLVVRKGFHLPDGFEASGTVKGEDYVCLVKEEKSIRLEECES